MKTHPSRMTLKLAQIYNRSWGLKVSFRVFLCFVFFYNPEQILLWFFLKSFNPENSSSVPLYENPSPSSYCCHMWVASQLASSFCQQLATGRNNFWKWALFKWILHSVGSASSLLPACMKQENLGQQHPANLPFRGARSRHAATGAGGARARSILLEVHLYWCLPSL